MRLLLALCMAVVIAGGCSPVATPRQSPASPPLKDAAGEPGWHLVGSGELARVMVERSLYRLARRREAGFLIHVRVTNSSASPIGVDLRSRRMAIYPNQWGAIAGPQRILVDERRPEPEQLDRALVMAAFARGELAAIEARGTLDYWSAFTAPGSRPRDVEAAGRGYVFVSLAGQQVVTDGLRLESFQTGVAPATAVTDLILPRPIEWQVVPAGGSQIL